MFVGPPDTQSVCVSLDEAIVAFTQCELFPLFTWRISVIPVSYSMYEGRDDLTDIYTGRLYSVADIYTWKLYSLIDIYTGRMYDLTDKYILRFYSLADIL